MGAELPSHTRTFTVEEARGVLPRVRELLESAVAAHTGFEQARDDLSRLEAGRTRDNTLALARPLREKRAELGEHYHALQSLMAEIQEIGCLVKGFDPALIDFPSVQDGRIVYLCWRLGEPEIGYWHEVAGNFYTRQPLP